MDLFEYQALEAADISTPLAERMRPDNINEFVGQDNVVGKGALVRNAIEKDRIFSMILWGPPGCGKTTLARIIARETSSYFVQFSAVLSGVKQIRSVIDDAKDQRKLYHKKTILFVDEIHRFNKAQQDAFLQHVESGLITLIGATTENPSFEIIPALMSRCRVVVLNRLSYDNTALILNRAVNDKSKGLGKHNIILIDDAAKHLINIADGDVRAALNSLEIVSSALIAADKSPDNKEAITISLQDVENTLQKKALLYDKNGEQHYNLISAFHKSLRGNDPDAALYWLCRMLASGEDPFYVIRRMVRFASEDVGNADPFALQVTLNAMEAYRFLGSPEGELSIAHAVIYLATAPKSNSIYNALGKAQETIKKTGSLPVPFHIRNAPTKLMKELGYGKNYKYAHDYKDAYIPQDYLPEEIKKETFYIPVERGYEKTIKLRLDEWKKIKKRVKKAG